MPIKCECCRQTHYIAPSPRGYAHLGIGAYIINHTRAGETPELIISLATEEEKSWRVVGDTRDNRPDAVLQPDAMVVRLRFENEAGFDALQTQLKLLREVHFPDPDDGRYHGFPPQPAEPPATDAGGLYAQTAATLCNAGCDALVADTIARLTERQAREIADMVERDKLALAAVDGVGRLRLTIAAQTQRAERAEAERDESQQSLAFETGARIAAEAERDAMRECVRALIAWREQWTAAIDDESPVWRAARAKVGKQ